MPIRTKDTSQKDNDLIPNRAEAIPGGQRPMLERKRTLPDKAMDYVRQDKGQVKAITGRTED